LPVDILKIDGMFVRDVETNPLDMAVVNAVTAVGRALGKVTVAEWVESEATLQCLREAGVDRAQGFVLHRPCPLEELVAD
ncbi:MAG: EAL domain-containing protein, partial [Xanthomonadales bacterium]|nr:EAL domain-containing protein [Xanthomonadales bacterium]